MWCRCRWLLRYFETPPVERMAVIRELLEKMSLIGHHH